MASNTDIYDVEGGLIQLTMDDEELSTRSTVLLTVRGGKDHDLSVDEVEKLGRACLRYAKKIREGK